MKFLAALVVFLLPVTAWAVEDLGGGVCRQSDGQVGIWSAGPIDDSSCITPEEYEVMFSPPVLEEAGVIDGHADNGDGTTDLHFGGGTVHTVKTSALDRSVLATPEFPGQEPTVGQWFQERFNLVVE